MLFTFMTKLAFCNSYVGAMKALNLELKSSKPPEQPPQVLPGIYVLHHIKRIEQRQILKRESKRGGGGSSQHTSLAHYFKSFII
jgi:hypothetical protein